MINHFSEYFKIVLVLSFLLTSCTEDENHTNPKLVRKDILYTGVFHGEIGGSKSIEIYSPSISGLFYFTVESVLKDGTMVKSGDTILSFVKDEILERLRIEKANLDIAVARKSRQLNQMNSEKLQLDMNFKRKQMLLKRAKLKVSTGGGLMSAVEFEQAKLDMKIATLELASAKNALLSHEKKSKSESLLQDLEVKNVEQKIKDLEQDLESMDIKSPSSGMVYAPFTKLGDNRGKVKRGRVLSPGDKVLELPDMSELKVDIYAKQSDFLMIDVGDQVVVKPLLLPNVSLSGRVSHKSDFAISRNERLGHKIPGGFIKEQKITISLAKSDKRLMPGNTAKVIFNKVIAKDALTLPLTELSVDAEGYYFENVKGQTQRVDIGKTSATLAEVLNMKLSKADREKRSH